jgi:hypothetical protein
LPGLGWLCDAKGWRFEVWHGGNPVLLRNVLDRGAAVKVSLAKVDGAQAKS